MAHAPAGSADEPVSRRRGDGGLERGFPAARATAQLQWLFETRAMKREEARKFAPEPDYRSGISHARSLGIAGGLLVTRFTDSNHPLLRTTDTHGDTIRDRHSSTVYRADDGPKTGSRDCDCEVSGQPRRSRRKVRPGSIGNCSSGGQGRD
jgi:hypothetical protein